jgi:ATP-dependent DNA helicase DinG
MVSRVAKAIDAGGHVAVQAGTGTGKSLGYLVPAVVSGERTVVATATKALQDQLAKKDLPHLQATLDESFHFAVLKGRSNYVCRQRLGEIANNGTQLGFDGMADRASPQELARLAEWAEDTSTGDRAELTWEPAGESWAAVSVSSRECPGASRCPAGDSCFAERARAKAAEASVIVVNTHLYGLHLASEGAILPEHDVAIIDEAHQLQDIISATAGLELSASRFRSLSRLVSGLIADDTLADNIDTAGADLEEALRPFVGSRLKAPVPASLTDAFVTGRDQISAVVDALKAITLGGSDDDDDASELELDLKARKLRVSRAAEALLVDMESALETRSNSVAWVEDDRWPTLRVAPLDVGEFLSETLWEKPTVVLTSATLTTGSASNLGAGAPDEVDVGSPFDFEDNALLYCATHLPEPRSGEFEEATWDELERLITAAGGRTLALFTSHRASENAALELRRRLDIPVLQQSDMPKAELISRFRADEATSLFATMSFWQGVDLPGRTLSLVTIDKIPFPRPDEPLLQARREHAREAAFRTVDLPRAATLLAQGVGRLIRTATDQGVVAVFDRRLATSPHYRWDLINALPPMKRTKDFDEVADYLATLTEA